MATRIVVFQVPDTQTEDDIDMAIAHWNNQMSNHRSTEDRLIKCTKASFVVSTPDQLRRGV